MSTQAVDDWGKALDQFEQRLAGFRAVLDTDSQATVTGMWPEPHLIGVPLPAEHVERARSLMAEAKEVEGQMVSRREELPPLRPVGAHHRRTPVSSFVTEL
ncbi:MAG: hypothetical protein ACRBK7_08885 [Acidimicrobiales bacterium]